MFRSELFRFRSSTIAVVSDIIDPADTDMIAFLGAAFGVQRVVAGLLLPVARQHQLTERTLTIIVLVHAGLDRPSLLVDFLSVLPSTMSSDVDKLVRAGLIRRVPSPDDRRVTRLEVTQAGIDLEQRVLKELHTHFSARVAGVSVEELRTCVEHLQKISGGPHPDLPDEICRPLRRLGRQSVHPHVGGLDHLVPPTDPAPDRGRRPPNPGDLRGHQSPPAHIAAHQGMLTARCRASAWVPRNTVRGDPGAARRYTATARGENATAPRSPITIGADAVPLTR